MIDIETLGSSPGSAVIALGAVTFDPFEEGVKELFTCNFSWRSNLALRLKKEPATVKWWKEQSAEAKAALKTPRPVAIWLGLREFGKWYTETKPKAVWANGSTFDFPLLEFAMKKSGVEVPWHYREVRDMRTAYRIFEKFLPVKEGEWREKAEKWEEAQREKRGAPQMLKHCALSDAFFQALRLQYMYRAMKGMA